MCRIPTGNGTSNGFDDTSSFLAGWRFGCIPTIQLVKVATQKGVDEIQYGSFGGQIVFNLTVTNKQLVDDTVLIQYMLLNGYPVQILDETGTFPVSSLTLTPGESVNITVVVTLPSVIPFIAWDNITLIAQSENATLFRDEVMLGAYVSPFIWPKKWADPTQIYVDGTGHDENTTITLNLTGMGAAVELIQPQDVIFCVDASGSMTQQAINLIKEGLTGYVDEMEQPDHGAVVVYQNGIAWPMNPLTDDYTALKQDIQNIPGPAGGTDIAAALNLANAELNTTTGNGNDSHIRVIILLTDGDNNAGDPPVIAAAQDAADDGILIFTIGLEPATGFLNEDLLKLIANMTGGKYYYAPTADELPAIYKEIAAYIGDIAGRDTQIWDAVPMIRDVLPPWIQLVPGSFSLDPEINYVNSSGYRIMEWNLSSLGIGKSWEVTFQVKALNIGTILANDVPESRVFFEDYFDVEHFFNFPEVWLTVLPSAPIPPKLYIEMGATNNDIRLYWDEPASPGTEKYFIYKSDTPTGFDFSSPWVDTSLISDNGLLGNRRSWNDTWAADGTDEQWYYCIRSVNNVGEVSHTSRTVGKWTKIYQPGITTFSLPVKPLPIMNTMASDFVSDMNARYIRWMHQSNLVWMKYGDGGTDDTQLMIGEGYEVAFDFATKYTFLGMPASHIQFREGTFLGFDPDTEADSFQVFNVDGSGNVQLSWDQVSSMNVGDVYEVYRSETRDGFDDGSATLLTVPGLPWGTQFYNDLGAAQPGTEYYYMVIPVNDTGVAGSSSYSLGVFTVDIIPGYDTIALPFLMDETHNIDWYCSVITNSVGINYYIESGQRWNWHSTIMPSGAFDPQMLMALGYQISTTAGSQYTFVGRKTP
jgi:uncharacterized protein YegL